MNLEEEHQAVWEQNFPGQRIPGSAEPLEGKCGAKIRNKNLAAISLVRHCKAAAGQGTPNSTGCCSRHGGSTPTHVRSAMRKKVGSEMATLAERLGEAKPIGPPEVEFFILASKSKQWVTLLEEEMGKLGADITSYDAQGVERVRAVIELLERGWSRFQSIIEFSMKHDLQKRVVELEEQQASALIAIIMSVILSQSLALTEKQVATARSLLAQEFTKAGKSLSPTWSEGLIENEIIDAESW
jgi:hypothetical protein